MSTVTILGGVIAWFLKSFGKDLVVISKDFLEHQWARVFNDRTVLFLGAKQAGKSSLIAFLRKGKPFEVDKTGAVRTPDPTLAAAVIDERVSVQHEKWLQIKQDLPGDQMLRATWALAVADFHPLGIGYIIDARDQSKIAGQVQEACRDVLDACYPEGPRELRALHLFLSFSDFWAHSPIASRLHQRIARDALEEELTRRPVFAGLRTDVAVFHLSPHASDWPDARRALERFGTDLSA